MTKSKTVRPSIIELAARASEALQEAQPTTQSTPHMNYFTSLASVSVRDKVERKGTLDYLSWANAWSMLKTAHPDAQRIVYESEHTGLNYFTDGKTAYVKVGIIVNGLEHIDYLPVMDFRNNAIPIDKVTSMDVNKTIQRSTAKAIAMHGLGLSLWTGEDVPEVGSSTPSNTDSRVSLEKGDESWFRVEAYVTGNKKLGLEKIIQQLSRKYVISTSVKKEIEKLLTA